MNSVYIVPQIVIVDIYSDILSLYSKCARLTELKRSSVMTPLRIVIQDVKFAYNPTSDRLISLLNSGMVKKAIPFMINVHTVYQVPAFRAFLPILSMNTAFQRVLAADPSFLRPAISDHDRQE